MIRVRIRKGGEKSYNALFPKPDGKPGEQISKTFRTKGEAQAWLAKIATEVNSGTYSEIAPLTVKEITERYLAKKKIAVRPGSYTHLKYMIKKHILPFIGDKPISKVNETMLSALEDDLAHMSHSLRTHTRIHLKGIFKLAMRLNAINRNVTDGMESLKKQRHKVGETTKKREIVLTNTQIHQLLKICPDPIICLYYEMAIYTGMRPSELVGLPIAEINLDRAQVHVTQTLYWYQTYEERASDPNPYKFQPTKSTAGDRIISLTPDLVKNIQIHLITAPQNKYNLLFARPNGDPLNHQNDIVTGYFKYHIKTLHATLDFPVIDFYTLRHNYAAILCNMAVVPGDAKYLMGHEDIQTTMNIYTKIRPDLYGNVVKDLGAKLQAFTADPEKNVIPLSL